MEPTEKDLEEIYHNHIKTLPNLSTSNGNFMIAFSGTPGCGKTTIAKIIENQFGALRINNDDIRNIIRNIFPNSENKEINTLLPKKILHRMEN